MKKNEGCFQKYKILSVNQAYRLLNHGPVVLVASRSKSGKYNVAPIAWTCPVGMEPCQVLLAISSGHQTFRNIKQTGEFIVCLPGWEQVALVRQTGSVSGSKVDKFKRFKIDSFFGNKVQARIPKDSLGFLECVRVGQHKLKEVVLVIGKCVSASVLADGFSDRLLVEKPAMKTLHHLGGRIFALPGDKLV
jgi:flavin reductase (DIM6/NTAB) family NADH-FMN oxidoreductase RutF